MVCKGHKVFKTGKVFTTFKFLIVLSGNPKPIRNLLLRFTAFFS